METKKRGWVKNAAIIFLSVMLVLTFFSNTILNWSLPEVSGQYAGYGQLSTSIRGSGTVEANMGYSVQIKETRKIKSVLVRQGDRVEAGQKLFELDASDSEELKTALETLETLEYNYNLKLLDIVSPDYADSNERIAELKKEIERSNTKIENLKDKVTRYSDINDAIDNLNADIEELNAKIESINEEISDIASSASSTSTLIAAKVAALEKAKENAKSAAKALKSINEQITEYSSNITIRLDAAKAAYEEAQATYDTLNAEYTKAKAEYEAHLALVGGKDAEALRREYENAKKALDEQQAIVTECENKITSLGDTISALEEALNGETDEAKKAEFEQKLSSAKAELAQKKGELADAKYKIEAGNLKSNYEKAKANYESAQSLSDEKAALDAKKNSLDKQKTVLSRAQATYSTAQTQDRTLNSLKAYQKSAETYNERAQEAQEAAQEALDDAVASMTKELNADKKDVEKSLKNKKEELDTLNQISTAETELKSKNKDLSTAINDLAKQQATDEKTAQKTDMDLKKDKEAIDKQKKLVEKLRGNGAGEEVTARYAGIITSVNCIAGDTANSGATLATIDVEGKGYTLNISVTNQQAQQVHVGDSASAIDYWWGNVNIILQNIKNDQSNPGKGKILEFSVEGDVSAGQSLNISIGERQTSYNCVVPTSAIREDKDGKFILTTTSKSTPIGNRYYAKRVNVTVLASDSTNSAIDTGESYFYDFVITNSTAPVEAGTQIRLAANKS